MMSCPWLIVTLFTLLCWGQVLVAPQYEDALSRAKRILAKHPLIDGHNDLAIQYRSRTRNKISEIDLGTDVTTQWGWSHTDIPRMKEGHVGGQIWAAFTGCSGNQKDAVRLTLDQIDVIKRFIAQYQQDFELVTTADGFENAFAAGKIGGMIGVEGGHSIDSSFAALRMFFKLGVRLMTLTHSCNVPWADSSIVDEPNNEPFAFGLTKFGKAMVTEMNRIGMMVDISHTSRKTQLDVIQHSLAPVVYSHSNAWTLSHNTRNAHDEVLIKMAEKGGVVMVTFVGIFLDTYPGNYTSASINHVADQLRYIRNLIGVDHIGIGSDFDGTSRTPIGLEDVSKFPQLFAELVRRGWSDRDLEKLAGGNILRVMREVQTWINNLKVPREMKFRGTKPADDWITKRELEKVDPNLTCRTLD